MNTDNALSDIARALAEALLSGELTGVTSGKVRHLLENPDRMKHSHILHELSQFVHDNPQNSVLLQLLVGGVTVKSLERYIHNLAISKRSDERREEYQGILCEMSDVDRGKPLISFQNKGSDEGVGIYNVSNRDMVIPWGPDMEYHGDGLPGLYMTQPQGIGNCVHGLNEEGKPAVGVTRFYPTKGGHKASVIFQEAPEFLSDGKSFVLYNNSKLDDMVRPGSQEWVLCLTDQELNIKSYHAPIPLILDDTTQGFFYFSENGSHVNFICARTGRIFKGEGDIGFVDNSGNSIRLDSFSSDLAKERIAGIDHFSMSRAYSFNEIGRPIRQQGFLRELGMLFNSNNLTFSKREFLVKIRQGSDKG